MAMQPLARAFTALEGRGRNQPGAFGLGYAQAEVRAKDHSAAPTGLGGPFRLAGTRAYASKNLVR